MATRREMGDVNLAVGSTIDDAAFGGGGGGWFTAAAGANSVVGKGSPVPTAAGATSFASGSGSSAGNAGGSSSFAWGNNAIARGVGSFCIGDNVGDNKLSLDESVAGQQNICLGQNLVVCSWNQKSQTLIGRDILMTNDGYDASYAYNNYTESQFAWGTNIKLYHQGIEFGSEYYAYAGLAIVMGDDHYIDTSGYGRKGMVICLGLDNHLMGDGSVVVGERNTIETLADNVWLFGNDNDHVGGLSQDGPAWLFVDGFDDVVGKNQFWWGSDHTSDVTGGRTDVVFTGGRGHTVKGTTSDTCVFLWGIGGSNGHQNPNEHMFGWSGLENLTGTTRGRCQYSFVLDHRATTDNTADQTCLTWGTSFRRGHRVKVEVIAYDHVNNDQTAFFELEDVLVYRSSHTGAPVLSVSSGVAVTVLAIPSVADTAGNSATWTARLIVDGTSGCQVQVTGATGSTVEWNAKLSWLETGGAAA